MTEIEGQVYVRRCQTCRGEQWITGPTVKDMPTIAPCPDCQPATAALLKAGAYEPDAGWTTEKRDSVANAAKPPDKARTALFPWPQMLTNWPAPGQRIPELKATQTPGETAA